MKKNTRFFEFWISPLIIGACLAIGYGSSQRLLDLALESKEITTSSFEKKVKKKEASIDKQPLTLKEQPILGQNSKSLDSLSKEEETFKTLNSKQNSKNKISQEVMEILSNTNDYNNKKAEQSMETPPKQKIKSQSFTNTPRIDKMPISIDSLNQEAELFFREQNIDELIKKLPKT